MVLTIGFFFVLKVGLRKGRGTGRGCGSGRDGRRSEWASVKRRHIDRYLLTMILFLFKLKAHQRKKREALRRAEEKENGEKGARKVKVEMKAKERKEECGLARDCDGVTGCDGVARYQLLRLPVVPLLDSSCGHYLLVY